MNEEDTQQNCSIDDNIEKFINSLLIVFHELGVSPEEGEKMMSESQLEIDPRGERDLFRYVFPNHFLYTLSEKQIEQHQFGTSENEIVIPIVDDRYFVVVAR